MIKILYLEKVDKPKFMFQKLKIEQDNCKIYANLEKEKNIKKVVSKIVKAEINAVVLSKELKSNIQLINELNSANIHIFDGRWLEKYLTYEILEFILKQKNQKKEETELAITTNEITDSCIQIIKTLAKQYKRVTVVTNHLNKLRKIEKELYDEYGILILVSNNQKKSLAKAQLILNMDFNKEVLNKYKINENAVILNLEGDMIIYNKRFNGINVNNYEIEVGREEIIWRTNMNKFETKELLEAFLYMKDTFDNIRAKIGKYEVLVQEIYGINGKIERFY